MKIFTAIRKTILFLLCVVMVFSLVIIGNSFRSSLRGSQTQNQLQNYKPGGASESTPVLVRPELSAEQETEIPGIPSETAEQETEAPVSQPTEEPTTDLKTEVPVTEPEVTEPPEPVIVNPSILSLRQQNPDTVGWLTLDNTHVDNVYLQAKDNDYYLRKAFDGSYLLCGSIFADYRCPADFSAFNTIIYGHNMGDEVMFGDLDDYSSADYFYGHLTGSLYLPEKTYSLRVFAFLTVDAADAVLYDPYLQSAADLEAFQSYVREHAVQYREEPLSPDDRILTLSTCSYSYTGARAVLLVKVEA